MTGEPFGNRPPDGRGPTRAAEYRRWLFWPGKRRASADSGGRAACPSEHDEQGRLVRWMAAAHPNALFYAVPNGGWRNKVTAAKLKLTGVKPGVPDLVLAEPRGPHHGLYIEMKRSKGGQLSKPQKLWLAGLKANGYRAEVCAGADAAMALIDEYLNCR